MRLKSEGVGQSELAGLTALVFRHIGALPGNMSQFGPYAGFDQPQPPPPPQQHYQPQPMSPQNPQNPNRKRGVRGGKKNRTGGGGGEAHSDGGGGGNELPARRSASPDYTRGAYGARDDPTQRGGEHSPQPQQQQQQGQYNPAKRQRQRKKRGGEFGSSGLPGFCFQVSEGDDERWRWRAAEKKQIELGRKVLERRHRATWMASKRHPGGLVSLTLSPVVPEEPSHVRATVGDRLWRKAANTRPGQQGLVPRVHELLKFLEAKSACAS